MNTAKNYTNRARSIINSLLFRWRLFLVSILVFAILIFVFNKILVPKYLIESKIIVTPNAAQNKNVPPGFSLTDNSDINPIENEIYKLTSFPLVKSVIKDLNLGVSYYLINGIFRSQLYLDSPFEVIFDTLHPQPINLDIHITPLVNNEVKIMARGKNVQILNPNSSEVLYIANKFKIDGIYKLGEKIISDEYSFNIFLRKPMKLVDEKTKYLFRLHNLPELTEKYIKNLKVKQLQSNASVLLIAFKGENIDKTKQFINSLIHKYIESDLKQKNQITNQTINYLNNQIWLLHDSILADKNYNNNSNIKSKNISLSIENEINKCQKNIELYSFFLEYFNTYKDSTNLDFAQAFNIENKLLNEFLIELQLLNAQKNSLLGNNSEKLDIELKIENLKNTVLENIKYNIKIQKKKLSSLNRQLASLKVSSSKTQRSNLFALKDIKVLYNKNIENYLLQKRIELLIDNSASTSSIDIMEPARFVKKSFPNESKNFLFGFILSILLPALYIILNKIFSDKIITKQDIVSTTQIPFLGYVFHNNHRNKIIVDMPNSQVAESFKSINTNLNYFNQDNNRQIFLITSSFSSEGKSFVSLNLAAVFAGGNKKTVLLGLDLRKPSLYKDLGLKNNLGISSFLSNRALIEDIVQTSAVKNLDFIPSGNPPPNPVELIRSHKMIELMEYLKENYDYIVIDTPPVGLVTDAYILMNFADIKIFITRHNKTSKTGFVNTIQEVENKNIKNVCVLLNDVKKIKGRYGLYYGYY